MYVNAQLKTPFSMICAGPSLSGKTRFVCDLINTQQAFLETPAEKIVWCSPHASLPDDIKSNTRVQHVVGLPWENPEILDDILYESTAVPGGGGGECPEDDDESSSMLSYEVVSRVKRTEKSPHILLVLDDFADVTKNSRELTAMFIKTNHHANISLIQLTQNLFYAGSDSRTRQINAHYIVLMAQRRDVRQIRQLARQMTYNKKQFEGFMSAYTQATGEKPFSHLLISCHPRDSQQLQLRSNVFNDPVTVYILPST